MTYPSDEFSLQDFMPGTTTGDDFVARAGSPLSPSNAVASRQDVTEALRTVYDPEIPVNIYDLGLIYELEVKDNGSVAVQLTLTAPGCPVAGQMPQAVADAVAAVDGIGEVEVQLVWEPAWSPDRASEDAKIALGLP
jgi:FeS assembly SUF system protein